MDVFTSMLESRINRIGSAFEVRDEEEGRVAMHSLMASAAMIGAARLHTVITTALATPFLQVDGGSLVGTLRVEAHRFRSSLDAFAV